MNLRSGRSLSTMLALPIALLIGTGCGGTSTAAGTAGTSASTALSTALSSSSTSSGTLLCAPAQGQLDACSGKSAGDGCSITPTNGGSDIAGTCRGTIDGASVACVPNPPAPPQELVQACAGKAANDTCDVTGALGDTRPGVCVTARDGSTLVCGRAVAPPQSAIDACASGTNGSSCTVTTPMGTTMTGVCSTGPAGSGVLACTRRQDVLPNGSAACTGLALGASCKMGRHQELNGTCTTPTGGGDAVCVVPCADAGGEFACRPGSGGPGGMMDGPGMGGGMMGGH